MAGIFGEVEIRVQVDTSRVLDIVNALDMLRGLLVDRYGHVWTDDETAILMAAVAACERKNLSAEVKP